jgi:hypothetical protein
VQVAGATWLATMKIVAGVGDMVQRIGNDRTGGVLGGRAIKRLVVPCAVCTVHMETMSVSFLIEPQNHGRQFVSGLASKPLERFSPVWPQHRW